MEQLALETVDDQACPGCSLPLHQTSDPDYPWMFDISKIKCIACEEKAEWVKEEFGDKGTPPGTWVTVTEGERVPDSDA